MYWPLCLNWYSYRPGYGTTVSSPRFQSLHWFIEFRTWSWWWRPAIIFDHDRDSRKHSDGLDVSPQATSKIDYLDRIEQLRRDGSRRSVRISKDNFLLNCMRSVRKEVIEAVTCYWLRQRWLSLRYTIWMLKKKRRHWTLHSPLLGALNMNPTIHCIQYWTHFS